MTSRIARWRDWSGIGLEHLVITEGPNQIDAEGCILGGEGVHAFAAIYRIACDRQWLVRTMDIRVIGTDREITLNGDGMGNWLDRAGRPQPHLAGAFDVDLSASPFTNTIPIRRLGLHKGQSADVLAVYVEMPVLTITTNAQRYTCLEPGRIYRYESLDSGFVRDLEVDDDALVITYPGLFKRAQ